MVMPNNDRVGRGLDAVRDGIRPHLGPACYYNYADEDLPDWPTAYWGANLPALQQVKAAYDPEGFFRGRHTVPLPGKA